MHPLRDRFGVGLFALALLTISCARHADLAIESPADPIDRDRTARKAEEELAEISRAQAHDESDVIERRPPLRQSISLGETWVPPRWALPYPMGYGTMPPAVVINNYNQTNVATPSSGTVTSPYYYPMVGYSGYPAPSNFRSPQTQTATVSPAPHVVPPRVGGDWPAVPSYGPRMMTHTAPSSTWPR